MFGFIRGCSVTSAAAPNGRALRKILPNETTSMDVLADTVCHPQRHETRLTETDSTGRIHRRKPYGKTMPDRSRKASAEKSAFCTRARARADHVFAH